jgi:hypothetical protein
VTSFLKSRAKLRAQRLGKSSDYVFFKPGSCHRQMAGPLSISASVVGITVPALHGTRLLLDGLEKLKDAPKTVKRLADDVHSVDAALKLLQGVEDREWE